MVRGLALLTLALWLTPLCAEESIQVWRIDPAQSSARFDVRALLVIPISGRFPDVEGSFAVIDGQTHASVRVPVGRLQMRSAARREWALSAEFFDAARHPQIQFDAEFDFLKVLTDLAADRPVELAGELSLRGISRAQRFAVLGSDCRSGGNSACAIELSAKVSRAAYGMVSHAFTMADTVQLNIRLVLAPAAP